MASKRNIAPTPTVSNTVNVDEIGHKFLDNATTFNMVNFPSEYTPSFKSKKGRVKPPKDEDPSLRRFPCKFAGCDYVAKYRSNLWDHKKTHTGEKPYPCSWPSCSMRFCQTHQLKLHLRSHTGERPYVCTYPGCNSAFSQKPGLMSHTLIHTGEKPFKCDFPGCHWAFRLKGALTDHKKAIHEKSKKFACKWPGCDKRFLQQCHLKKHIMGHANIKPFSCDWPDCGYKAVTQAYVTNHQKTHTGEKNYKCNYCNKLFVKSNHVNRHRQQCHPELFGKGKMSEGEEKEEKQYEQVYDVKKESATPPQILYLSEEEGATTFYIQSKEEEEMVSDESLAQFIINGSVVTSDTGEQFLISTSADSGELQAVRIELKQEMSNEDVVEADGPRVVAHGDDISEEALS